MNEKARFLIVLLMLVSTSIVLAQDWPMLQYGDTYQGEVYRMVDIVEIVCDYLQFTGEQGDWISISIEALTAEFVPAIYLNDPPDYKGEYLGDLSNLRPVQNYTLTLEASGVYWIVVCAIEIGERGEFSLTLNEVVTPESTSEPEYVVRALDRGEYQLDLIFDSEGCLLVNGHDLIVREIQNELEVLNSKSNNVEIYAEIFQYLAPVIGGVERLREQVGDIMFDINSRCTSEYFYYRVGNSQRGIRFVDPSGLGNIAYGYFSTLFTAPQWTQDVVADIDQSIRLGSRIEAVIQCGVDTNCIAVAITVVGDNIDDRRQRLVGEQMARSDLPLTVDLFIRYSNTYSLY